ncbi:MAG: polysaccharide biosynthesis/export family protein [Verrucomicrobiales bacterium]|nr:polysaccharide biosynthesis/export family protein [Verrucomicrobiales bacterium]
MKPSILQQSIMRFAIAGLLGGALSSCTPTQEEGNNRAAFFKSKATEEVPCKEEVCAEPEFQCVKIEKTISPILLRPPAGRYRIGPGDELDIEIAEDANTRATAKVMPDGLLYYNVANGINVKGMTIREVSDALADALSYDYVDPIVTVNVASASSQRFWILGQVKNPGTFPLEKPTTLIAALSRGEGLGVSSFGNESEETVDLSRAILIRDKKLVPVDFEALIEDGDMSQNVYVHPNDYIYLPSRQSNSVYVLGAVNNPGPVLYDHDSSLLSAVASAGGPRPDAIVTKALIIRGSTNEPNVSVVNLQHLMRGTTQNLKVKGGDIIWLPRSMWTNIRNYTEAVLTTAAQAVAVQEGLAVLGSSGSAGVTITAGN